MSPLGEPTTTTPESATLETPTPAQAPAPVQTQTSTVQPKPLTIDHPMGKAPIPPEEEHVILPRPVQVPDHILSAEDDDLIEQMVVDGEGILTELVGGAMHDRLQNLVSHFRHVLVEARSRFLTPTEADESKSGAASSGGTVASTIALIGMFIASLFWVPTEARAQVGSQFPAANNAAATAAGPAGAVTNPTGNNIAVSPGPVFCNGAMSYIHNTVFTLTGLPAIPAVTSQSGQSQLFYVSYSCSLDQVMISVTPSPSSTNVQLATVLQSNSAGSLSYSITDIRPVGQFPNMADFVIPFSPGDCFFTQTGGTLVSSGQANIGASLTTVQQISTSTTAPTITLTCNIHVPYRTTASKGYSLNDCTVDYGVQTTALTSLGAPTLTSITMPAPGTAETPSTVTPVSLGAVTVTPVVGSANLGLTTAGAFFTEKVALTTPVFLNTDQQVIQYQQQFLQSAGVSQVVNTPGGVCHATGVPL